MKILPAISRTYAGMSSPIKPSAGYRTILRSFAPNSLLKERDTYLRLGPKAGATYIRLKILNMLSLARSQTVFQKRRDLSYLCVLETS